jgi:hypothetical protein
VPPPPLTSEYVPPVPFSSQGMPPPEITKAIPCRCVDDLAIHICFSAIELRTTDIFLLAAMAPPVHSPIHSRRITLGPCHLISILPTIPIRQFTTLHTIKGLPTSHPSMCFHSLLRLFIMTGVRRPRVRLLTIMVLFHHHPLATSWPLYPLHLSLQMAPPTVPNHTHSSLGQRAHTLILRIHHRRLQPTNDENLSARILIHLIIHNVFLPHRMMK